jgi:NAD(P)H-flavin reductase
VAQADDVADDAAHYADRLRRSVGSRAALVGDPSLTALLHAIEDRRARRAPATAAPARPGPDGHGAPATRVAAADAPRLLGVDHHGPTVRVLRTSRPAGLVFDAGQYVKLGIPGGPRTKFSIASAPHEPHLDFAIERRPNGRVTTALFGLGVGDVVDIAGPAKGGLRLDPDAAHHLMVATVTGIAPLRSLLRDARHRGSPARFTVLLGARHAAELPFHDELIALAARDPHVDHRATITRPGGPGDRPWTGHVGRVDALAHELAIGLDPSSTCVYAVGHPDMIDSVRRVLGPRGFGVRTESYGR